MSASPHTSVMLAEVLEHLSPADGETYVDGTFGAGGYSRAILESADCRVVALDRDPSVQPYAQVLEQAFPGRFSLVLGNFAEMKDLLQQAGEQAASGVVLDLGVSSMQLDEGARGFSFRYDAPLDMRMGSEGLTAAEFINSADEREIADVIYKYGEERESRKIAKAIVARRMEKPFVTTFDLAGLVRGIVRTHDIDPATRTFQAIRIHINQELESLEQGLEAAADVLLPGGRLVVVSFHSLEDRIVKQFLVKKAGKEPGVSRHSPALQTPRASADFSLITRKAVTAGDEEIRANPRARSAKLRAARRSEERAHA